MWVRHSQPAIRCIDPGVDLATAVPCRHPLPAANWLPAAEHGIFANANDDAVAERSIASSGDVAPEPAEPPARSAGPGSGPSVCSRARMRTAAHPRRGCPPDQTSWPGRPSDAALADGTRLVRLHAATGQEPTRWLTPRRVGANWRAVLRESGCCRACLSRRRRRTRRLHRCGGDRSAAWVEFFRAAGIVRRRDNTLFRDCLPRQGRHRTGSP